MIALTAALLLLVPVQEEESMEKAWPKLIEAWNAVEQYKNKDTDVLDDEFITLMGKLHDAFKAAGFLAKDADFETAAIKRLFKLRAKKLVPKATNATLDNWVVAGGAWTVETPKYAPSFGMDSLFASVKKLRELKEKGLDDEDNVADEMTMIRKSLKSLHITADDTPLWLRRRVVKLTMAIVVGDSFPARARATKEQVEQIEKWIENLGGETLPEREEAVKELIKIGEAALPYLRKALKDGDPEVVERVKQILGVGHQPWRTSKVETKSPNAIRVVEAFKAIEKKDD